MNRFDRNQQIHFYWKWQSEYTSRYFNTNSCLEDERLLIGPSQSFEISNFRYRVPNQGQVKTFGPSEFQSSLR